MAGGRISWERSPWSSTDGFSSRDSTFRWQHRSRSGPRWVSPVASGSNSDVHRPGLQAYTGRGEDYVAAVAARSYLQQARPGVAATARCEWLARGSLRSVAGDRVGVTTLSV